MSVPSGGDARLTALTDDAGPHKAALRVTYRTVGASSEPRLGNRLSNEWVERAVP